jgi:hypothetical protein
MSQSISTKEISIIRDLAQKVAAIAADPINDQKRDMWIRLNRLERVRPLIYVQAIAWNIWEELIPPDQLETIDPFARRQELELRKRLYCWDNFRDDRVVDGTIACPIAVSGDLVEAVFGLEKAIEKPDNPSGAHAYHSVIASEEDIEKIQTEATPSVDWEETERRYERLSDLYDGTLQVEKRGPAFFWFYPMDLFSQWRGIEQMFIDLIEHSEWVHAALERITSGYLNNIEQLEKLHVLSPGNGNTQLGSGGFGWSDELPQPDFDGEHVRLKDQWARAATQIFTEGISPDMHDEFALQYEKRLLHRFGLSCYGCCEPLDKKMHIVRKIKNLRRVSMSPWVDVALASEAVGRDYVYSHKPHPAMVSTSTWEPDQVRKQLRDAFGKTRDNILELSFQDLHTVHNEPHRLTEWTEIALQLAEEYA